MKKKIFILSLLIMSTYSYSQELICDVIVNITTNSTSINPKIFKTLEQSIENFMNSRRWTNMDLSNHQKIQCAMVINITDASKQDVYKFDLSVSAERPVFGSTYTTNTFRHIDKGIAIKYVENDPIDFSDNRYIGNLGNILGFYANFIIARHLETFKINGGSDYFDKCVTICNNVPSNSNEGGEAVTGWQNSEAQGLVGDRTRVGMALNYSGSRFFRFREEVYNYYRLGLDEMYKDNIKSKGYLLKWLDRMKDIQSSSKNYIISEFILTKTPEILSIFETSNTQTKEKIKSTLQSIEPSSGITISQRWKE